MRLVLFDIDGTLIASGYAGRTVLSRALEQVFGIPVPVDGFSLAGKTDKGAILELTSSAGIAQALVESQLPVVYEHMEVEGKSAFIDAYRPLPGVLQLLAKLHAHPSVTLGLLTGNSEATAPLKLAAAGIRPDYFQIGAYGSDDADRNRLVPIAICRATMTTGYAFIGNETVVVGDTPADIQCARVAGAGVIAVANGFYSARDLESHRPDHLLPDLTDVGRVISLLLSDA